MTREESIALADRLGKEYAAIEKIQQELDENNKTLDRPYSPPRKVKEWSEFYNGYLLAGILLCVFVMPIVNYFISAFAETLFFPGDYPLKAINRMIYAIIFMTIAEFAGIQLFGYFRSKSKMAAFNKNVDREIRKREEKVHALRNRNSELLVELADRQNKLMSDARIIPVEYRTSNHMHQVKKALSCSKAETFEDAIALLRQESH